MNNIEYSLKEKEITSDGIKYSIKVKVPMSLGWINRIDFIYENNKINSSIPIHYIHKDDNFAYFENEIFLNTSALYHFYFTALIDGKLMYINKNGNINNDISNLEKNKISVNFSAPDWAKGKMMYHIFVDRFNKSDDNNLKSMPRRTIYKDFEEKMMIGPNEEGIWNVDFYGGNLKGIEEKLDYIKSLGVSILYLSPICYSQSNHRYDTSDYEIVDPYLGTNDDLKSLCQKAHELGIKVIIDFVFNHTGNDSKYFNEYDTFNTIGAFQSKDSPYYEFYKKSIIKGKEVFHYWWGFKNEVVCDGNSKKWQDYIYGQNGIISKYFDLGIDGIRYDVLDELSDPFIENCNKKAKEKKEDTYLLGEVWKNPMRMNREYVSSGKGVHSVMNYLLIDALLRYYKYSDVNKLKDVLNQIITEYPNDTILSLMNFTSTHDITRAINLFAVDEFKQDSEWAWNLKNEDIYWQHNYKLTNEEYEKGKKILKSYLFTLCFLPGNLSIFYGDEIGIQGMGNLSNRKPFSWNNIDNDLLEFYKKIGNIRNIEKFLEQADLNIIDITKDYFMFEREENNKSALITINRTEDDLKVLTPDKYLDIDKYYEVNNSNLEQLKPYGGVARIRK